MNKRWVARIDRPSIVEFNTVLPDNQETATKDSHQTRKMVIFTAPSGAGKTTLVRHILNERENLAFSVSACTRPQRDEEVHGRDYYFLSREEFEKKIGNGEFLEWEEVYEGTYYGTLRSEVERLWKEGKSIIFDIDVQGALSLKTEYGQQAFSIFVKPPSVDVLESRLMRRGTEQQEIYRKRIEKAREELSYQDRFDYVIVNDELKKALREAEYVVERFLRLPEKGDQQ